jgi:hypothetical protein
MVLTKWLRFRHILFSICLIIILITGTGIASAAVGLRASGITNDSRDVHQNALNYF